MSMVPHVLAKSNQTTNMRRPITRYGYPFRPSNARQALHGALQVCRRAFFLWRGASTSTDGMCKMAWRIVCTPKLVCGFGVPHLRIVGFCLARSVMALGHRQKITDTCRCQIPANKEYVAVFPLSSSSSPFLKPVTTLYSQEFGMAHHTQTHPLTRSHLTAH